ncbi:hypothetical protein [Salinimonas chungwhensis]|uniref:hypothetical protein n=1 Tax=Salinimonas chungwhensis TaxID=265425 RepID=UPI00037362D5|nr:hypothetical protein [Salinimonas chungwhensis]
MNYRLICYFSLFIFLAGGCSYVKQPNDRKMKKLLSGMPEYAAEEDFGNRDFRFLIVRDGDSVTEPAVPECLVTRFGTKELSNTSYEQDSYAYEKYAAVATVYAKHFNAALLRALTQRDWDKCDSNIPAS